MKKSIILLMLLLAVVSLNAQVKLDYYLPDDIAYNTIIPRPGISWVTRSVSGI